MSTTGCWQRFFFCILGSHYMTELKINEESKTVNKE